jgi:hypothetical protein
MSSPAHAALPIAPSATIAAIETAFVRIKSLKSLKKKVSSRSDNALDFTLFRHARLA